MGIPTPLSKMQAKRFVLAMLDMAGMQPDQMHPLTRNNWPSCYYDDENKPIIEIDWSAPTPLTYFQFAHEMAHILLGHLDLDYSGVAQEYQANVFACQMLYRSRSPNDLPIEICRAIVESLTAYTDQQAADFRKQTPFRRELIEEWYRLLKERIDRHDN